MSSVTTPSTEQSSLIPVKSYARLPQILEVPNLIQVQLDSFRWFMEEGLHQLFEEISPIKDFTGNRLEISFVGYEFHEPRYSELECRQRDLTYSAPLYVKTRLLVKTTGEIKEQDLFFGDIPLMTTKGTFITGGAERVVVSQLLRSPGVYLVVEEDPATGRKLCQAKLIPSHGAWLEFETSNADVISVKINGKRKIQASTLLRAIGYSDDDEILKLFKDVDTDPGAPLTSDTTIEREPGVKDTKEALISIYRKLRPGDPPNEENARRLIDNMFFNPLHYDLGQVGRYKLNKRLGLSVAEEQRALVKEDIVEIIRHVIMVNNGDDTPDDIDHLGNRRVRTRRRAGAEPVPHRPGAPRARGQGAHEHHPGRSGHAERAGQYPPGGGRHPRVLRQLAAFPVHGPDQPAGRADPQAASLGHGPARPVP